MSRETQVTKSRNIKIQKHEFIWNLRFCDIQGPKKGGRQCPGASLFWGAALLVKRRISKWPFTDEPEVRFRFWIFVKVGPTIRPRFGRDCPSLNVCPGVPSRLAKCPGRHFWVRGQHVSTRPGEALPTSGPWWHQLFLERLANAILYSTLATIVPFCNIFTFCNRIKNKEQIYNFSESSKSRSWYLI